MASKGAGKKNRSTGQLPIVHGQAAGIDIGSRFHVVAVSPDLAEEPVQTFNRITGDLHRLADWLVSVGVTTVAMESTGIYWIPLLEILEARHLEVLLVNARLVKHVPGRKTDVNDAQWGCNNCPIWSVARQFSPLSLPAPTIRASWHSCGINAAKLRSRQWKLRWMPPVEFLRKAARYFAQEPE
ncbi:MAG: transposase [Candidatus Latescibacteria bacterium]|nr:transposase [Candidatus Latescibacterota bacterium]